MGRNHVDESLCSALSKLWSWTKLGVPKRFGEQRQEGVSENHYRLMPSAWWSPACLACLSICEERTPHQPSSLKHFYQQPCWNVTVCTMPFSLLTGLSGPFIMLRFHSVFHYQSKYGETEDLAAKTGQSNPINVLCNKLLLTWKAVFYWMLYKLDDGQAIYLSEYYLALEVKAKMIALMYML